MMAHMLMLMIVMKWLGGEAMMAMLRMTMMRMTELDLRGSERR